MKRTQWISMLLGLLTILWGLPGARAQDQQAPPPLDDTEMEQLVAPVALYPDPLLAQVLPAATYPDEVQSAESWLQSNPNPSEDAIDQQSYDPSIKALLHYPDVLAMMSSQIDWTQQLGLAFLYQQTDVMAAVQRLRQRALNAGTLQSGPQIQVVNDADGIAIVPADDNQVYVPEYDPDAVYIGDGGGAYITWGPAYPVGLWLNYDFDWHDRRFGIGGGWNRGWVRHGGGRPPNLHEWQRDRSRPLPPIRPGPYQRPGFERPGERPPASAFGGYQNPADVRRDEERGRQTPPERQRPVAPRHEAPAPPRAEPPRAEPPRAEPPRAEPPRAEPPRAEPPRAQPPRTEPPRAEPPHETPHPAPPSAFRPEGGGRPAGAAGERGHASMGGGGRGGAPGGGAHH